MSKGKQKTSGMVFDRIFIRHWDAWNDGRLNRLFVTTLADKPATTATLVSGDVIGDVPSRPFGDSSEYTWAPDGQSLVFSARIADAKEPTSTNFDLYQVSADGTGAAKNLTAANPAWDTGATFSADGKTLYYRAMKRPGFEADRFGLIALDLASGQRREIAPQWDRSADGITLSADGKSIYTTATDLGEHPLFAVDIASGKASKLIGEGSVSAIDLAGPTLAVTRNSLKSGDVLYTTSADATAPLRAITATTGETLKDVAFGDFEQFNFKGWNGDTVHGYVVKPWNYVEGKKYPVAFLIHGGPQGSFGNGWSYRWNPQTYAGQGYAVVMIDFHGSTGYGQAFTDAISQHWGDRPLEDLQKGWAAAQQKYSLPQRRQGLRAGRQLRRLHGQLDRRQLEPALEVPGQPRRRVRPAHDGLRHRGTVVHRVGAGRHRDRQGRPTTRSSTRSTTSRIGACRCWSCTASSTSASRWSRASARSPRCSSRGSSRSSCTSRTRTTGCSSRRTPCSGTTRSTPG